MAVITPSTDLYLLKVPIEIDNANQLTFANATAQYNYFSSLEHTGETDFTYQRKDDVIRYPAHIDSILNYNYVMYRNDNYTNKWFYAFITDMRYINDGMTEITIKTDVWQTWQFDLEFKQSFVEREHVSNDTIGLHTVPEGVETGEYVINGSGTLIPDKITKTAGGVVINSYNLICFQVTKLLSPIYFPTGAKEYNRVYTGLDYIAVESAADADKIVQGYAHDTSVTTDAIQAVFMLPKEFFAGCQAGSFAIDIGTSAPVQVTVYRPAQSSGTNTLLDATSISINTTIDGYTPHNKKLFTSPFNYLSMSNNVGTDTTFNYEDFASNTPNFYIHGTIGVGGNIRLEPVSYKHHQAGAEVAEYGISGAKYPVCGWINDTYINWLTQNGVNTAINGATSLAASITGMALSPDITSMIGSGISTISNTANVIHQFKAHSMVPPTAEGNLGCSDITFASRRYFSWKKMSIRNEYAQIIDKYLDKFGYKVNMVKLPNLTGRRNWNYVKTIGCGLHAYIPQEDCDEIKQMFDNGITLWHNASTFLDYSQNNDII